MVLENSINKKYKLYERKSFMRYLIWILICIEVAVILLFYCSYKKEKEYIKKLVENQVERKIKVTLQEDLVYFLLKTYIYKGLFYCLNIAVIYINAFIPILNQGIEEENRIYISVMAAIASVCTSFITFSSCHKNWTRHRNTFEILKYEVEDYIYESEGQDECLALFEKFYSNYKKAKLKNLDGWIALREEKETKEKKNKMPS